MYKKMIFCVILSVLVFTTALAWSASNHPVYLPLIQSSPIPEPNSLYLGMGECVMEEVEAIFVTNARLQVFYENGEKISNPYIGSLACLPGGYRHPFHFKHLDYPNLVLALQHEIVSLGFIFDNTQQKLYVSISEWISTTQTLLNPIYEVELETLAYDELWQNEIGLGSRYNGYMSDAKLQQVVYNYLVLALGICYGCDGFNPTATIILNTHSKEEKYLGEVGNVVIDLNTITVSYQYLYPETEPCEPSPGCGSDGTRVIYVPSGEVFVEHLP